MTEKKLVRETFFKFFTTALASSVVLSVLSMTDLMIAGNALGERGLAAVSLALPVMMAVQIAAALWGMGGAIVFSARLGEGDFKACGRIFTLALVCSGVTGMVLGGAGLLNLEKLVLFLGAVGEEEIRTASQYINTLLLGLPFMILAPVMNTFLRNDSRQTYSFVCVVSCALLNVALSLFFCFGLGLGMRGIGAATTISQGACCVMAGAGLFRGRHSYGLCRDFFSRELVGEVLKPGLAVSLIFFCQILLTVVVNRILNVHGGAAVYGVVKYMINFLFALFDGVTGAIQPMLGIYYGEREKENIRYTAGYAFGTMMVLAFCMFVFMELGGGFLCRILAVGDGAVAAMTVEASRIMGVWCFGAGAVTFLNAFYRCVGKERLSFLIGPGDNLIFPLASIFFFVSLMGLGTKGVFFGLCASSFVTLIFLCIIVRPWERGVLLLEEKEFPATEHEFRRIVPASIQEVSRVMEDVEAYGEKMEISPKTQYYIVLSLEELVINVIGLANTDKAGRKKRKEYYADIRISPGEDGSVSLRIRDNLTEWTPAALDMKSTDSLVELDEAGDVNELGIGIVKKIAKTYSYKRTIGFNNFSVTL